MIRTDSCIIIDPGYKDHLKETNHLTGTIKKGKWTICKIIENNNKNNEDDEDTDELYLLTHQKTFETIEHDKLNIYEDGIELCSGNIGLYDAKSYFELHCTVGLFGTLDEYDISKTGFTLFSPGGDLPVSVEIGEYNDKIVSVIFKL